MPRWRSIRFSLPTISDLLRSSSLMERYMAGPTALTPAPTTVIIAPTPLPAAYHSVSQFDPIEILPPNAADKLRALRQRASDSYAITVPHSELQAANTERIAAEKALERLRAPAGAGGFNLGADHPLVHQAQKLLDKLTAAFTRMKDLQQQRSSAWQANSQALATCEAYLKDGRPPATTLEDHPPPEVKLNKGESLMDGILRLQRRCRELERAVVGSNWSWDSRISEILIQPVGWAEASRRWQSRIHKTCVTA